MTGLMALKAVATGAGLGHCVVVLKIIYAGT